MASCTCQACGQTWPYADPALVAPCPKCGAKIGRKCTDNRPSEHRVSFGLVYHDEREEYALAQGLLTKCPKGPSAQAIEQESVTEPARNQLALLEESES